jgi:hypothetical protein
VVRVGQQPEAEVLGVGERLVVRWGIEGRAQDDAVGGGKFIGPVTQALALDRSAPGRRLRVPPQQHPVAPFVGQRDGIPVLVRKGEVGCGRSRLKHGATLIAARQGVATGVRGFRLRLEREF